MNTKVVYNMSISEAHQLYILYTKGGKAQLEKSSVYLRGVPDPDLDPAGHLVDLVDLDR